MVCASCGAPLPPNAMACPNCGTQVMMQGNMNAAPNMTQQNMGGMNNGYQQPNMGGMNNGYQQQPNMGGMNNGYQQQPNMGGMNMGNYQQTLNGFANGFRMEPGMTWHVVLQVLLIIGAVSWMISGFWSIISYITAPSGGVLWGIRYGVTAGERVVGILYGLCSLGLCGLMFLTMVYLNKRKLAGPKFLMLLFVAEGAINFLFPILQLIVGSVGVAVAILSIILGLGLAAAMIVVNKMYYDKRMQLFS